MRGLSILDFHTACEVNDHRQCSLEKAFLLLFPSLLLLQCIAVVDAVLDAKYCMQPGADDGHQGFLILIAEELRNYHPHILLEEHCLH